MVANCEFPQQGSSNVPLNSIPKMDPKTIQNFVNFVENWAQKPSLDLYRISRTTYSSQVQENSGFKGSSVQKNLSELKQKFCCDPWAVRHRLVNTETGESVAMQCDRYDCLYCGPRKVSTWRSLIEIAEPERFITLTRVGGTLADVGSVTHSVIQRLRRGAKSGGRGRASQVVRKAYEFEYLAVYEKHKNEANGFHIHLLQKGDYIPQKEISEALMSATHGRSYITNIKQIKDKNVAGYVTKYLTKGLQDAEVGYRPDGTLAKTRRIRYSKHFFPSTIGVMRDELRSQWLEEDELEQVSSWILREAVELPRFGNGRVDHEAAEEQYYELVQARAEEVGAEEQHTRGGLMILAYMLRQQVQIA